MGPVWACLSSLLGCFVLRLLLWASPSLGIEARGQSIPNVQRHFFPACIPYFNFCASFIFKRLKKDNNSHVVGHSLNLQFIFFHWALWERDVCAWPWISPSYKAFESGDLILLFMPHLCTIGANLWAEHNYVVWWAGQMAGENACEVFWYFWGTAPISSKMIVIIWAVPSELRRDSSRVCVHASRLSTVSVAF